MSPQSPPDIIIYRLSGDAKVPTKGFDGDAGWDLVTSENTTVYPGKVAEVPTGLFLAMPHGFWGHIVSRSSTTRKHGIVVLDGIIDNGYRGEMFVQVFNPAERGAGTGIRFIKKGTRLAQLIFHRILDVKWYEQAILPESKRGENGFGSTGL